MSADGDASVETCSHHWHGPFADLDGQEQCCECGELREPEAVDAEATP